MPHRTSPAKATSTPQALAKAFVQMQRWPDSWKMNETDVAFGEGLVRIFEDFLTELYLQGLSTRTINRHRGNLWVLGGELVRHRWTGATPCSDSPAKMLSKYVSEDGGPLVPHPASDREQQNLDATCRKLFDFLPDDPKGKRATDAEA